MAQPDPSSTLGVVYNAPMALNQSLSCTQGLEPKCAKHRNRYRIQSSRRFTVGPMPVAEFMRQFIGPAATSDRKSVLSARGAFHLVPADADTPEAIYMPLVRSIDLAYASFSNHAFIDRCSEQEDEA